MINAITPGYIARRRLVSAYTDISINVVKFSSRELTRKVRKVEWVYVNLSLFDYYFMVVKAKGWKNFHKGMGNPLSLAFPCTVGANKTNEGNYIH